MNHKSFNILFLHSREAKAFEKFCYKKLNFFVIFEYFCCKLPKWNHHPEPTHTKYCRTHLHPLFKVCIQYESSFFISLPITPRSQ